MDRDDNQIQQNEDKIMGSVNKSFERITQDAKDLIKENNREKNGDL